MIRVITAIVLGAAVLAAVWWLPAWGFNLLVLAAALAGLVEFGRIFLADPVERCGMIAGGGAVAATMIFCRAGAEAAIVVLAGVLFGLALLFMKRARALPGVAERWALAMLGVLYLGVAFSFWAPLRGAAMGRELVLLALVPACLCDTFAYLFGKAFGKRKFAPMVSPNKTMAGFGGALVGSLAGTFAVRWLLVPHMPWASAAAFAAVVWIVSPFGDLVESMLKRSAGVKDSGTLIPGHGGILDRLDALIFTGPAAYAFAWLVWGLG